jgi:hypothetical protein
VSRRRERGRGPASGQRGAAGGGPRPAASRPTASRPARSAPSGWQPGPVAPYREPARISFPAQVGILVAVFAVTTLIAELAGAANLGVSLGIATIPFSIALVLVILRT